MHTPHTALLTSHTSHPTHTSHTALLTSHAPRTCSTQHSSHRTHHAHAPYLTHRTSSYPTIRKKNNALYYKRRCFKIMKQ